MPMKRHVFMNKFKKVVKLKHAGMCGVKVVDSKCHIASAQLSKLTGITLSNCEARRLEVENTSIYAANLDRSTIKSHLFTSLNVSGSIFGQTKFVGGTHERVIFKNSAFLNCVFERCGFKDVQFIGCTFSGCIFFRCKIKNPDNISFFNNCDFKPDPPMGEFHKLILPEHQEIKPQKNILTETHGAIQYSNCSNLCCIDRWSLDKLLDSSNSAVQNKKVDSETIKNENEYMAYMFSSEGL